MQSVVVACLSLAAKMEETEVPLSLDLRVNQIQIWHSDHSILCGAFLYGWLHSV